MNIVKSKKSGLILVLMAFIVSCDMKMLVSMEPAQESTSEQPQKTARGSKTCKEGKFCIYSSDPNSPKDISVDLSRDIIDLSKTLKEMVSDLEEGGIEEKAIPIPYSVDTIKKIGNILTQYAQSQDEHSKEESVKNNIKTYSFDQLIDVTNCIHFLDCQDIEGIVCDQIKDIIDKDVQKITSEEFQLLNANIQKSMMIAPIISQLKKLIIKKYAQSREKRLREFSNNVRLGSLAFNFDDTQIISHYRTSTGADATIFICDLAGKALWTDVTTSNITSVALSPNGKTVVCGCYGNNNNLYMQNRDSQDKKYLVGHPDTVASVAFNSAGNKIISGCFGAQNNLIMWDISNPAAITQQPLMINLDPISQKFLIDPVVNVDSVAFSQNDTKIFSLDDGKNLKEWNASAGECILELHVQPYIHSVAFSSDGTKIACVGGDGQEDSLIVLDISDKANIIRKELLRYKDSDTTSIRIAFSFDSKSIVAGKDGDLLLWDISDYDNMPVQRISGFPIQCDSIAFSHDGKKIIVGNTAKSWRAQSSCLTQVTLLTDEEDKMLAEIKKYEDPAQIRLLYKLCRDALRGSVAQLKPNSPELDVFNTLPVGMQALLSDLLWPQNPGFSSRLTLGWWK